MGNDERQKVKKTYEQGLAAAEAELKRLEGKSGFRKFFDNALKEEIDEARAAVEFQKTRLASFESFMAAGSGGATPSGAAGGTLSGGSSGGGGNKGNGTDKHQALLDRIMADNETLIDKDLEAADKLLSKRLEDMLKKDENDKKAKLEAFDRKIKDMESGHTLSVQNIRNNFSSQKAAAGIWQSGAIDKAMNEAIIKEDLGYLQALKEKLSVAISEGMIEGADIPDDQKDKLKQKLAETIGKINELTAQDKANNSGIWGGTGGGTLFGISEAQWGQFFYNLDHHDASGNTVHPDVAVAYPDMAVNSGSLFGLKLEFGRDYFFCKFLRLSTSLSVGTTFGGFKSIPSFDHRYDDPYGHTPNSFARTRILSAYWFGLKVGIGVLTF